MAGGDGTTDLGGWLVDRSDGELLDLIASGTTPRVGWGTSRTVDIDRRPVFVKALPLTTVELERWPSTANLFDLPPWYQYGVGSAGFGAGREVAAHQLTSEWVHAGRTDRFPLLHHERVLPLTGQTRQRTVEQLDRYQAYWDGSDEIRRFVEARQGADHAVVLFVEHLPHVLMDWVPQNDHTTGWLIEEVAAAVELLRAERAVHFDVNPANVLTDGRRVVLGDLGLFCHPSFDLSTEERAFLDAHRHLDLAEFIASLEWPVPGGPAEPPAGVRDALRPHRGVVDEMTALFARLADGPKVDAGYDDALVAGLLDRSFVRSAEAEAEGVADGQ